MINRILIRLKVVQLLYSYLLSRNDFKLPVRPGEDAARDNRYAYEFYLDILRMILEMNGIKLREDAKQAMRGMPLDKRLRAGELGQRLWKIDALRAEATPRQPLSPYDTIIPGIYKAIPTLPAYKTYSKKATPGVEDEIELWQSVIYNLIEKNKEVASAARRHPLFTYTGFHRGVQMAIDLLQSYNDNRSLLLNSKSALELSLSKARQLYVSLMHLPVAITQEIERRQEEAKEKLLPSDEDLHPNTRLVENALIKTFEEDDEIQKTFEEPKISWIDDYTALNSFINLIQDSELYKQYMDLSHDTDYAKDCEFWEEAMKTIILPSDTLAEKLENSSVYWNDDLQVIGEFVIKTFRRFTKSTKEGKDITFFPAFKDKEDEEFGPKLFMAAATNYDAYRDIITSNLTGTWEANRVALMDMVIMISAVAEMLNFPSVPVAVTLNEFVEIAGDYSTEHSREFINAVLRQVASSLREQGKLNGK